MVCSGVDWDVDAQLLFVYFEEQPETTVVVYVQWAQVKSGLLKQNVLLAAR